MTQKWTSFAKYTRGRHVPSDKTHPSDDQCQGHFCESAPRIASDCKMCVSVIRKRGNLRNGVVRACFFRMVNLCQRYNNSAF